ncbi:MAG: arginine deiminase [Bacteroidetes bacterium]|nr:arginine deiminase [Bacteroidota bacterium]
MSNICINSEIGRIRKVILHQPGQEIERMTPSNAAEVLYDDILHLPRALREHNQLEFVLSRVSQTYELVDLLRETLTIPEARETLVNTFCSAAGYPDLAGELLALDDIELPFRLIHGTLKNSDTLERYLSSGLYSLPPLPNFFFMRDAAMCVHGRVITGSMANHVRVAEAIIMENIFKHHPDFRAEGFYFDGTVQEADGLTIEGGDVLILREDVVCIGNSERTSIKGIDTLIQSFAEGGRIKHVIVVEMPKARATIHLDMIFTMIDRDKCVVFPPLITGPRACRVIHVEIDGRKVKSIEDRKDLLSALAQVGLDLEPIPCGGTDQVHQEREQWTSGANFFTIAPGQIIGYGRNKRTFDELGKRGFRLVRFEDLREGNVELGENESYAISIEGAELSRGGGGCRCMTLPVLREPVSW